MPIFATVCLPSRIYSALSYIRSEHHWQIWSLSGFFITFPSSDRGNCNQTVFLGAAWNWRGAMSPLSANGLLAMGLTKSNLGVLTVRVLELGFRIYAFFKGSTHRVAARNRAHKGGNGTRDRSGAILPSRARRRKPPAVNTCT